MSRVRAAHVQVHDRSGVQSAELAQLDERLPIYLQWSEDGSRLAALSQKDDRLILSSLTPGADSHESIISEGSPLFFTWCGTKLATYVGGGTLGARMMLFDPSRQQSELILPGVPGNFCAPLWMHQQVIYVARHQGRTALLAIAPQDAEPRVLEVVDGLVALIASPDGRTIARAIAPNGDGTPYRNLALIDTISGEIRQILEQDCLAFVWAPPGDRLLVCRVDTERNVLIWQQVDLDGTLYPVIDMMPTRDLGFYLRFFEQYAQSHRIVSPDGQHLLVAGGIPGRQPEEGAHLWQINLRTGGAEAIAEGMFGVYAPVTEAECLSDEN